MLARTLLPCGGARLRSLAGPRAKFFVESRLSGGAFCARRHLSTQGVFSASEIGNLCGSNVRSVERSVEGAGEGVGEGNILATSSLPIEKDSFWLARWLNWLRRTVARALRMLSRTALLSTIGGGLAVSYPVCRLNDGMYRKWLSMCVYGVECSGAAVVKLFQWASR